jgi:hypothetical protein
MREAAARTERRPYHGPCFICGPDNPDGLDVEEGWNTEMGDEPSSVPS